MEKTKYELRAEALKRLVEQHNSPNGRGGIAKVAKLAGFPESLVGRMLYQPGKKGGRKIGEDSVDKLTAAFPDWLGAAQAYNIELKAEEPHVSFTAERHVTRLKPKQDAIAEEICAIIEGLDSTGRAMALAAIKVALHNYQPAMHQTPRS